MNRLLEIPTVYNFSQKVLLPGAKSHLDRKFSKLFSKSSGKILDVGCGPLPNTPIPNGILVGIDSNQKYIKSYTGGYVDSQLDLQFADRKIFGIVANAENLPFPDHFFDEARCMGVLHHLDFESAKKAIQEMIRCTRSGGKVIVIDNVLPPSAFRNPFAWAIRKLDRGKFVRTQTELESLLRSIHQDWEAERFTYTSTGLELMSFLTVKK